MLDAACPGQVFTSPTPDQMMEAAEAVDAGAGVLLIIEDYEGDVMNFGMAAEMAEGVMPVLTNGDVAVEFALHDRPARCRRHAGRREDRRRRGRGRHSAGRPEDVRRPRQRGDAVNGRGADLMHGARRRQTQFRDGDDEMEFGVGIHGEPGRRRDELRPPRDGRGDLRGDLRDLGDGQGRRAAVRQRLRRHAADGALSHVNSARKILRSGRHRRRSLVGNYVTSLDMAGCSLTVTLLDDERRGSGTRRCIRRR